VGTIYQRLPRLACLSVAQANLVFGVFDCLTQGPRCRTMTLKASVPGRFGNSTSYVVFCPRPHMSGMKKFGNVAVTGRVPY
jgi:hypothetical protein